jgi:hypothetical protein
MDVEQSFHTFHKAAWSLAIHARCRETTGLGLRIGTHADADEIGNPVAVVGSFGQDRLRKRLLLAISPATVHFHVERVKRRLAATSRTEAVALLVLHGAL